MSATWEEMQEALAPRAELEIEVVLLRNKLQRIEALAQAGLCCFSHSNTREYLKDIRNIVEEGKEA